ncbi:hypothetical protein DEU56DRAFT_913650 [Suillus clintonianus]|uniref:uncharacterized protein n=1 Tax=Suillus clintonianus TaxID=1904413 RepID=UPI001B869582|nr:uncharacterized protein DEU56DRAFT_913650 [Suillus clintonianus]KAG2134464.1 hypothetical protein DEU56DRAFT_913650 [Suillus clintonianus]
MSSTASPSKVAYSMTLPNELWLSIFEYLSPHSLRNLVLTSKNFHAVAIRLLYKHLILTSPTSFVTAYSALSSIQPSPYSLLLGISPLVERPMEQLKEAVAVVSFAEADDWTPIPVNRQSTRFRFFQIKDAYQPRFLADATVYDKLITQVTSQAFTSLRQVVFRGMLLPRDFHSILRDLPHLRDLAVVHCTVHFAGVYIDIKHTSLKIESLTLIDIRSTFPSNDDDINPRNPRTRLRMLAKVPTLRTLTYDHTVWLHHVFTPSSPPPPLIALDVKFPIQKDRPRVPQGFISFLETLPSLRTLILRNHVPALPLSPNSLPALCAVSAPLSAISSICSGPRIIKLDIRDEATLTPLYKSFAEVHSHLSRVQELSLFVGDWDDEVMLAIVARFPMLTKLQVRYARGGPSEDTILGMGSRTLYALPHLVSARIFCIPLLPPPQNVLELRKRDDDTAYGAPGIDNTYLQSMHDIDSITDTLMEGVLSLQQLPFPQDVDVDFVDEQAPQSSEPFDDYTRELVIAWNRTCPGLRTVQLHPGWVWRRADSTDYWVARPCESGIWGDVFG